jgi:hypothetical protein
MFLVRVGAISSLIGLWGGFVAATEPGRRPPYDEQPIFCAAYYHLLAHGFEDLNDPNKARKFQSKFEELYEIGEKNILAVGGTKNEAQVITQRISDTISAMFADNAPEAKQIFGTCLKRYPIATSVE